MAAAILNVFEDVFELYSKHPKTFLNYIRRMEAREPSVNYDRYYSAAERTNLPPMAEFWSNIRAHRLKLARLRNAEKRLMIYCAKDTRAIYPEVIAKWNFRVT